MRGTSSTERSVSKPNRKRAPPWRGSFMLDTPKNDQALSNKPSQPPDEEEAPARSCVRYRGPWSFMSAQGHPRLGAAIAALPCRALRSQQGPPHPAPAAANHPTASLSLPNHSATTLDRAARREPPGTTQQLARSPCRSPAANPGRAFRRQPPGPSHQPTPPSGEAARDLAVTTSACSTAPQPRSASTPRW